MPTYFVLAVMVYHHLIVIFLFISLVMIVELFISLVMIVEKDDEQNTRRLI